MFDFQLGMLCGVLLSSAIAMLTAMVMKMRESRINKQLYDSWVAEVNRGKSRIQDN